MKLSRDWIADYVDISDLSDADLAERFTQIGHAVESMVSTGDDTVFDLEITTNRVDAMSHFGMARELGAALGRPLNVPPLEEQAVPAGGVRVEIADPEMCSRYTAAVIRGVRVGPSPERIRRRLEAAGLRPINNVVDVTNYVMLAFGHPLHAFDLDRLQKQRIVVRRGQSGETMRSLDGEMRSIDSQTVVIADGARAVALGGVIGGAETEIGDGTTSVLLECAWFEPGVIRRTSKRLGLRTDASYRFERRVDPNGTRRAIEFAARLIVELAGGTRGELVDVVAREAQPTPLALRFATLRNASGGAVGEGYALELFKRLELNPELAADGLRVSVPTFRGDLHEEADLVEEVLRFYGLNNVPAALPRLTTGDIRRNAVHEAEDEVRRFLASCALSEAITYAFIRADSNASFTDEEPVRITNSLSENTAVMRLSLLPGLLEAVAFNRSYGSRDGGLFEVGRTYHRSADGVVERSRAAFVLFGATAAHWGDPRRPLDFFDAKGIIERLASRFHVELEFARCDRSWLRNGKRAVARDRNGLVATLGVVAPEILQRFDIKGEVVAA
ncbi:MAG TPA: phenylalanine--tRNA ligase subunit beta, partial [Thermoanaerobaculia bacterium]|nr:phenylalanine--tRNA ligase subunit beta [Thermoanaerobaculia bacterium]